MPDALILSIIGEQSGAKAEERGGGKAIILKHDSLRFPLEKPRDRPIAMRIATQVLFLIKSVHLTIPINGGNNQSCLLTRLAFQLMPRPVCR